MSEGIRRGAPVGERADDIADARADLDERAAVAQERSSSALSSETQDLTEAGEGAQGRVEEAREALVRAGEKTREEAQEAVVQAGDSMRRRPGKWAAGLVAGVAGVVAIGALFWRRARHRNRRQRWSVRAGRLFD